MSLLNLLHDKYFYRIIVTKMSRFGELLGGKKAPEPTPAPTPTPQEVLTEVPVVEEPQVVLTEYTPRSLEDMTKDELEEYGRGLGIELDKRHSKRRMISEIRELETNS
tara:strand:+ start:1527 stop:1850 length:324 start_codon:yes stop_codon:yes gene_type:complete